MSSDEFEVLDPIQTGIESGDGFGPFALDDTPTAEIDRVEMLYEPLVASVRDLVDATIRSRLDGADVDRIRSEVDALVARLRADANPGPAGVRFNAEGRAWNWGNAAVGCRNAVAPPLRVTHDPSGLAHAEAMLGAAYEGPPGLAHGGVVALLLDHIMGETASAASTRIAFTGTLTMKYRRGTNLGPVTLESWIAREDGRKIYVDATVSDDEGVTVEAEGVFIVPAWAVG